MAEQENNSFNIKLQGAKGEPGDSGTKGDSGIKGDTGARGEKGEKGQFSRQTIAGYLVLAVAAILGVYFVGSNASQQLKSDINHIVSTLCVQNIPRAKAENKLRDVQIGVVLDTKKLNLKDGDTARAAINDRYIKALRGAKRHVPTVEECKQPLLK